jgi:uncharacterized damage-inducible protein DinB
MSLATEQAKTLCDVFLADIRTEAASTKKVLAAVPADKSAYAPSQKSMTAIKLCNHITGTDVWFLNGVANGVVVSETMSEPNAATPAVSFLSMNTRHNVHHRGQLSFYLRPMDAKVPAIYGPSGDSA